MYASMVVSDTKRLKAFDEEEAKLKNLLAKSRMDLSTLREMLGKNFRRLAQRGSPCVGQT